MAGSCRADGIIRAGLAISAGASPVPNGIALNAAVFGAPIVVPAGTTRSAHWMDSDIDE